MFNWDSVGMISNASQERSDGNRLIKTICKKKSKIAIKKKNYSRITKESLERERKQNC